MIRLMPRLLPTVGSAAAILLAARVVIIWQDVDSAFAATSPAAAEPAATTPAVEAPTAHPSGQPETEHQPTHYTASEVEVLQELAKRRAMLDQRAEELDRRDLLAKAAEQRVDQKLGQLDAYRKKIEAIVGDAQNAEDERVKALVKVYETMKPPEAAAIFEGMEIPALLPIVIHMKEAKTAPILAALAPDKARAITLAIATRKPLPEPKPD